MIGLSARIGATTNVKMLTHIVFGAGSVAALSYCAAN